MSIDSLLTPLARALSQSQELITLAEASNWDAFTLLVKQRQEDMSSINDAAYLALLIESELDSEAKTLIQAIQDINLRLTALAQQNREQLAADLRHAAQAAKAIDAYSR